uniref:RNA-dependent RNA polymerase n=3 Tax=Medicago sativa deltapartitivirus 1 TaxID=2043551 RepID=A0A291NL74_9VIRU|nr:RNA-dependent RNA polymerase [Medicago sativa deltapartitivirus 1]QWX94207.1 RNA-dependent RNA polymerase [Medicago sativa deltapartitivirus 1]QWX94211.1 RNA-dependent RNA polymerase [Medicago sativa deltapartitivirus 1]UEE94748.1 RNA-dependent RNA polymerase [Medicago sativa deltapartitivirus 1]UEE94750.1 RNA-dependent RNA polymerase [Medicago sativa deltapartitivirus 1]
MVLNALHDYDFLDFRSEVERTSHKHSHGVRREPYTTEVDRWAKGLLMNLHSELYKQSIEGWSRSYYDPARHLEAIYNYAAPDIPLTNIDWQLYTDCALTIRQGFYSLPRVKAYDVRTELDKVSYKASSAAGYSYQCVKGPVGGPTFKLAVRRARKVVGEVHEQGVPGMKHLIETMVPDIGHTRTQLTNLLEKTKVRNVWGRAFQYILIEGTVADPLIRMFSESKTFYHIGRDPLDSVPEVISEAAAAGKWLYAIDWKQFDATVSKYEIVTAFELIRNLIDFPNEQTQVAFEISKQLFIHKKIAAPDGWVYWVHKGIPSGSYFTSIIGSIVNRLRIEYLWRKITGHGPKVCFTQGDDSLSSDDQFIPPERFAEVAYPIGWIINPDKTEYSTVPGEVSFLGRTMIGGSNVRDTLKCIRLLMFPEYPVESPQISAYRAQSIAEDAGGRSAILNEIASKLKTDYGVAQEHEVPAHFKRYVM